MPKPVEVPAWLLGRLFLNRGVFNEERTAVISGYQEKATDTFAIDLTARADWKEVKKRLAEEGFMKTSLKPEGAVALSVRTSR